MLKGRAEYETDRDKWVNHNKEDVENYIIGKRQETFLLKI